MKQSQSRLSFYNFSLYLIITVTSILSCNSNQGTSNSQTKENTSCDTLAIIKAYFKTHQSDSSSDFTKQIDILTYNDISNFISSQANFKSSTTFDEISSKQVDSFISNYDKKPLALKDKGFMIDSKGFTILKSRTDIHRIFLRFGKKSADINDKDYTIMILPVDKDGYINKNDAVMKHNYDNLDPCPGSGLEICPKN